MTNKITCLADAINHVPRVRVIKEWDEYYNQEFDIARHVYHHKAVTIDVWHMLRSYWYEEIQFLTPVQYEWRFIGLGDKVNSKEVFDYCWYDWQWCIRVASNYNDTRLHDDTDIESFEPLHKLTPKIELSTEELLDELKRRWVVTQWNIINN